VKNIRILFIVCCCFLFAFTAYAQPLVFDPSFDNDGIAVIAGITGQVRVSDLALQPDGKIVCCGWYYPQGGETDVVVTRTNLDGSPDISFGNNGIKTFDFSDIDQGISIAVKTDNKIVIGGFSGVDILIMQLNSDGSPDSTFSNDGLIIVNLSYDENYSEIIYSVEVQADNKILAGGFAIIDSVSDYHSTQIVLRFLSDGSFDPTFGQGGKIFTEVSPQKLSSQCTDLKLDDSNRIIASGYAVLEDQHTVFSAVRYLTSGELDSSFATNGIALIVLDSSEEKGDRVWEAAIQDDGKIMLAGETTWKNYGKGNVGVARLNTDGTPDISFSNDGLINTHLGPDTKAFTNSAIVHPNGKVYACGTTNYLSGIYQDIFLVRYNANGSIDSTLDDDGIWFLSLSTMTDYGFRIKAQADGRILIASMSDTVANGFILIRLRDEFTSEVGNTLDNNTIVNIYPNPFSESANIQFSLAENSAITIELFDLQGRKIKTIKQGNFSAGTHSLKFSADDLPKGVYFLQLKTVNFIGVQKVVIQSQMITKR
jgi:uncharacterized delta-60 repeat protein